MRTERACAALFLLAAYLFGLWCGYRMLTFDGKSYEFPVYFAIPGFVTIILTVAAVFTWAIIAVRDDS